MKRLKRCMGLLCPYHSKVYFPCLHGPFVILSFLGLFLCNYTNGQTSTGRITDTTISFPEKFYHKIDQQSTVIENKLIHQADKYLDKLSRQEGKLDKLLQRKSAASIMTNPVEYNDFYKKIADQLHTPLNQVPAAAQVYIPYLDTLMTTLRFLNTEKISGLSTMLENQQSLQHLIALQGKLDQVNQLEKLLMERKHLLETKFQNMGFTKELKKYSNGLSDFRAQVKSYHDLINQPDKMIATSLMLLQKVPAFQQFFRKNSMLASFFRLPGNDQSVDPKSLMGLQTRSSVEHLVEQQFGTAGLNMQHNHIDQMAGMETYFQQLKEKLHSIDKINPDLVIPDYKTNPQKVKSFGKRLEYGINIQSVRANSIFPSTTDLGLSIGYRFSENFQSGIGASYKIGWGQSIQKLTITHQGVGLRTFLESRIKNTFFLSGGFEMNYRSEIREIDQLKNSPAWQKSALLGITKKFRINNKLKGNMQLLFDFLYDRQTPRTSPVLFRIGYGL